MPAAAHCGCCSIPDACCGRLLTPRAVWLPCDSLVAQDWRYYRGSALSEADVFKIAEDERLALRTCAHSDEGADTTWTDLHGHDCAWWVLPELRWCYVV